MPAENIEKPVRRMSHVSLARNLRLMNRVSLSLLSVSWASSKSGLILIIVDPCVDFVLQVVRIGTIPLLGFAFLVGLLI